MADEKKVVADKKADKPVKKAPKNKKPNIFARFFKYCKEVKSELRKVTWPSAKQVARDTLTVIIVVVMSAIFIGVIDIIFKAIISLATGNGFNNIIG